MPKRRLRTWEQRGIGRCDDDDDDDDSTSYSSDNIPKITVDGVDYWSDRFYLVRPVGQAVVDTPHDTSTLCACGAKCPPPLLDRGRLVESLEIQAAIVGTYTLDLSWMAQEFPSLMNGSVPTLVLHGQKGLVTTQCEEEPTEGQFGGRNEKLASKVVKTESMDTGVITIEDSSDEEACGFQLSKPTGQASAMRVSSNSEVPMGGTSVNGVLNGKQDMEDLPPEEGWLRGEALQPPLERIAVAHNVHVTEILTTWLPPRKVSALSSGPSLHCADPKPKSSSETGSEDTDVLSDTVDPTVVSRRKYKLGVHHPKYMILFEKGGSVIVVVSTCNMTRPVSTDASWVQRFEPRKKGNTPKVSNEMRKDGSDFGHVLANFLQCQSNAAREGEMVPQAFMREYLCMNSLDDFRKRYKFEEAQAHLIATAPGDHPGRHSSTHLGRRADDRARSFLYGPQRVADILHRLGPKYKKTGKDSNQKPWLPHSFLSNQDRLVVQTTSFGAKWRRENFAELVRSYFAYDDLSNGRRDDELLDRTDILWPTRDYMKRVRPKIKVEKHQKSPDSVLMKKPADSTSIEFDEENVAFIFLSSKSFNTIDLPVISRMAFYEPSFPRQMAAVLPPHVKTFGRMFEGDEYTLRKQYGIAKAEECFSWLLLTSACLSMGAQGKATPRHALESDDMTYANFELGVMFISRLQGKHKSDRMYCWNPTQCTCGNRHAKKKGASMVHLPIPHCLRPHSYQNDPDEAFLCETPYFHEITEGTGFAGQMTLTPLGAAMAASRK